MIDLKLAEKLSNAFGPCGFEEEVAHIVMNNAADYPVKKDLMQNVYINLPSEENNKPVIALDGHTDKIGFMVQSIMTNGLLKILPLGGWIAYSVPAHIFMVRNSKSELHRAVSTCKTPHF